MRIVTEINLGNSTNGTTPFFSPGQILPAITSDLLRVVSIANITAFSDSSAFTPIPSGKPTTQPSLSMFPSTDPSNMPSGVPSVAPSDSPSMSSQPSTQPSISLAPSAMPSNIPSRVFGRFDLSGVECPPNSTEAENMASSLEQILSQGHPINSDSTTSIVEICSWCNFDKITWLDRSSCTVDLQNSVPTSRALRSIKTRKLSTVSPTLTSSKASSLRQSKSKSSKSKSAKSSGSLPNFRNPLVVGFQISTPITGNITELEVYGTVEDAIEQFVSGGQLTSELQDSDGFDDAKVGSFYIVDADGFILSSLKSSKSKGSTKSISQDSLKSALLMSEKGSRSRIYGDTSLHDV